MYKVYYIYILIYMYISPGNLTYLDKTKIYSPTFHF